MPGGKARTESTTWRDAYPGKHSPAELAGRAPCVGVQFLLPRTLAPTIILPSAPILSPSPAE
jgi:hypothetical protein